MEADNEETFEIRAVIKFLVLEGDNATNIHHRLTAVYGTGTPAYSTVAKWAAEFKRGRRSLHDDPRSGRPTEATTPENIEAIRRLVEDNPRLKTNQIATEVGLSKGSVIAILHEHLHLSKIAARWIPHNLSPAQQADREQKSLTLLHQYQTDPQDFLRRLITGDEVWVFHHDPESKQESMEWRAKGSAPPLKTRQQKSAGKVMATIFWDTEGVLLVDYMPHGRTINGEYFAQVVRNLHDAVRTKRRGKLTARPLLLIDNAPAHTSAVGQAAIRESGFVQLEHPPYSPDLAPSDYYLFRLMKKDLRGRRFADDETLTTTVGEWFETRPEGFYRRGLEDLPVRWNKCIAHQGVYFEKL